jgi:hypothetical protein
MAKKSSSQGIIKGLEIFKHKEKPKKKKTDKYSVEKIQKEDKFKIINSLSAHGIHYRYSILLHNENSATITDINIRVLYPEFLEYTGSFPINLIVSSQIANKQEKINNLNLSLKELKGNNSQQMYIHFTPSNQVAAGEFKMLLNYKNDKGKARKIKTNAITIQIEDIVITPKIISHSRIRDFSKIPGMKRALVSLGIGTKKKSVSKKIYDIFERLILSYNFQLITKDRERGILWFFGSESNSSNDIFAISKIGLNIIEIIGHSKDPVLLCQFFFSIERNLNDLLLKNKVIKPNMKIFDLECINCGSHLPYFPKKRESITCTICSYKQFVW